MNFMQCSVPYADDSDIQGQFERLFIANGCPEEMALFCRTTEDRKSVVYLLTPTASELYGLRTGRSRMAFPTTRGRSLSAMTRQGLRSPASRTNKPATVRQRAGWNICPGDDTFQRAGGAI
jgi:hypothetical protein